MLNKTIMTFVAISVCAVVATAQAETIQTVYLSVSSGNHTVGTGDTVFYKGDILAYEPVSGRSYSYMTAQDVFLKGTSTPTNFIPVTYGYSENIDGLGVLPNYFGAGNDGVLLSTTELAYVRKAGGGILAFRAGDIILVNHATKEASLYLTGNNNTAQENGTLSIFRTSGGARATADIDALALLSNGHLLLSTGGAGYVGNNRLNIRSGDVVDYNPLTDTASLYFNQDLFLTSGGRTGGGGNVDGVGLLGDGHLLLSTTGEVRLHDENSPATNNTKLYQNGDIVEYYFGPDGVQGGLAGLGNDDSTLFFDKNLLHCGGTENIDAFCVVDRTVPEPGVLALMAVGSLILTRRRAITPS